MSQGIYKITNTINGKCYVGKSVDIKRRWAEHKKISKRKDVQEQKGFLLSKALKKYGLNNFKFEILELVKDENNLIEREKFYYNLYNYNLYQS